MEKINQTKLYTFIIDDKYDLQNQQVHILQIQMLFLIFLTQEKIANVVKITRNTPTNEINAINFGETSAKNPCFSFKTWLKSSLAMSTFS